MAKYNKLKETLPKERLLYLLFEENLSRKQIAKDFGISQQLINKLTKKYEIIILSDICCVCDISKRLCRYKNKTYCSKHFYQVKRYGHTLERTRFDPNEIEICNNFAKILLYDKNGNKRDETIIDLDDVEKCELHKWHKKGFKGKEYAFTRINGKSIRLHRYLLNYYENNFEIDHIDGNSLNNRKENLRIVSHQENVRNQKKLPSNNKTGCIGVRWHTQNHNWVAGIKINGRNIHLGSFENIENAIQCRKDSEKIYFTKETLKSVC